jgi:hypothetical protein
MKRRRPRRSNPELNPRAGDYDVGYRKPPKNTRFAQGQSGNPMGRPRGVRNFKSDVKATLKSPVNVTQDGTAKKYSTQKAALLRLREKALGGDGRSLDRLIELARAYDDDGLPPAANLSTDDAALLDVFKTRVLSGAASAPDTPDDD